MALASLCTNRFLALVFNSLVVCLYMEIILPKGKIVLLMIVVGPWCQSSFGFQSLGGAVAKEHLRVRMKAHFFQLKTSLGSVMLLLLGLHLEGMGFFFLALGTLHVIHAFLYST